MKLPKIILFGMLAAMLLNVGCGPQASQQGTWSRDDGFKRKVTQDVKEPKEKPADTVR
ncbi:MAG: hypothetical protein M3Y27_06705 [Acidobacteriota bacterium]|nr:hypothetical protein [Acidobacteriota bacterium]